MLYIRVRAEQNDLVGTNSPQGAGFPTPKLNFSTLLVVFNR